MGKDNRLQGFNFKPRWLPISKPQILLALKEAAVHENRSLSRFHDVAGPGNSHCCAVKSETDR